MSMEVKGQVGPQLVSDGSGQTLRQGRLAELVTQDAHGRYYEAVARQYCFVASTAAAGVAPGTALSTTPPFVLWNPPSSGVLLSVLRSQLGYVSGTLGAGSIVYAAVTSQATIPSGGTELSPVCLNISAIRGSGRAFQGSTLASTPTILKPMCSLSAFLATTAVQPFTIAQDDVAGEIVVPPGAALVVQGVAAAGTTPLVLVGVSWEEVPMLNATS